MNVLSADTLARLDVEAVMAHDKSAFEVQLEMFLNELPLLEPGEQHGW